MFRTVNIIQLISKNGWDLCQIVFFIYLAALAIMDWKKRKVHICFLLSGIVWAILGGVCERTISTVEIALGVLFGMLFLLISKVTKESLGYGDSILILIIGAFIGFWNLVTVLFIAFFLAALFSIIMLLKTKFHRKSMFPFIPFLMAAYVGGMILSGY